MRIGEVANALGLSRDYLRRLERRGVIPAPRRDLRGQRRYTAADVEVLRVAIFPSRVAGTSEGRDRIAVEVQRLRAWAERNQIPWTPLGEKAGGDPAPGETNVMLRGQIVDGQYVPTRADILAGSDLEVVAVRSYLQSLGLAGRGDA
jgi:excisionase family DNA binding protein